jgi:hypothetical protein
MNKSHVSILFALMFAMLACSFVPGSAAAGTTGTLNVPVTNAQEGMTISIRAYDLTAGADYALVVNGVTYQNFTCSDTETSRQWYLTVEESAADTNVMTVALTDGAATDLDTKDITVTALDVLIPQDFLINLAILALTVGIIVAILVKVVRSMK